MSTRHIAKIIFSIIFFDLHPGHANSDSLENRIWRERDGAFLSPRELTNDIFYSRFVVLGETHGFSAHQGRIAFLIAALADRGRYPALVLEMIDPEGAEKFAEYRRAQPEDASDLAMALNWGGSGWPSFQYYKPIFEIALHAKLEIAGGELPAHANRRQSSTDADRIDPRRLASWRDTMSKAHCDLISAADLDAAARLQIARDDSMLQTASQVAGEHGTIVVAGRSHVRRDRNLPGSIHPDEIRYIALIEADTRSEPRTYLPPSINGAPPFDYIWFTPAKGGETACERLRRRGLIP